MPHVCSLHERIGTDGYLMYSHFRVRHSNPSYFYCFLAYLLATTLALIDSQGSDSNEGTTHLQDDGGDVVVGSSVVSRVRRRIVDGGRHVRELLWADYRQGHCD